MSTTSEAKESKPVNTELIAEKVAKIKEIHDQTYTQDLNSIEILSTIRYDPNISTPSPTTIDDIKFQHLFLFQEHIERLKFTIKFFELQNDSNNPQHFIDSDDINQDDVFTQIKKAIYDSGSSLSNPLKIRLLISFNGNVKVEVYPAAYRENLFDGITLETYPENEMWDIYIDKEKILPSPFTSFKTTSRDSYNQARIRSLPGLRPGKEEVIITNTNDEVMEGSITNIALKSNRNKWVTSQLTSGCLCGVMRHSLLKKGYIQEETIIRNNLKIGNEILLFNGVMGVVRGKIVG